MVRTPRLKAEDLGSIPSWGLRSHKTCGTAGKKKKKSINPGGRGKQDRRQISAILKLESKRRVAADLKDSEKPHASQAGWQLSPSMIYPTEPPRTQPELAAPSGGNGRG